MQKNWVAIIEVEVEMNAHRFGLCIFLAAGQFAQLVLANID